ncbi:MULTISPECIES: SDR family oxidoreductase [Streptomyces]|uniref:Short-chain dehydrogenase/reductase SDR n=1 Tax=Streptomyces griseoaurantiacus M045 TaxID=996637 RepID=F3N9J7_9ACTN|nr:MULTISPECIES: SDR family oxidoreductase [Streptomyces]EGG49691.1 short-chain dehydrogenase/reductase SDR [Streptomyces griseoaurantiacus M045]MDX3358772.1 SDR family oxidoreductase [Streptomyces sp. ME02-6978.2a]NJP72738.1 SDR family oxidoreductase [Streptomyces sp. C1-2]
MTTDRIALVTGANRGLGRSAAVALAARGMRVLVTHRGDTAGAGKTVEQVRAAGGTAAVLRLDLSDVSSFPAFTSALRERLERWGASRLDVLVNNAGVGIFGPLEGVTTEDFDTVMGTNVRGTFFLVQALVPLLAQGGHVINVSTSLTRHTSPATSVYSASKAAVEALSRTLAAELGPHGIRVNSLAPGPTATDFNGGAMRDDAGMRRALAGQTALGRVGEPEEIGDAIATLASEGLRWVTAQRIEVSGGALL